MSSYDVTRRDVNQRHLLSSFNLFFLYFAKNCHDRDIGFFSWMQAANLAVGGDQMDLLVSAAIVVWSDKYCKSMIS